MNAKKPDAPRKLVLRKKVVREMSGAELQEVQGGGVLPTGQVPRITPWQRIGISRTCADR